MTEKNNTGKSLYSCTDIYLANIITDKHTSCAVSSTRMVRYILEFIYFPNVFCAIMLICLDAYLLLMIQICYCKPVSCRNITQHKGINCSFSYHLSNGHHTKKCQKRIQVLNEICKSWARCCGEEKNLLPLLRIDCWLFGCPAHSQVTVLGKLSWLPNEICTLCHVFIF
jgi:hypothetical protein